MTKDQVNNADKSTVPMNRYELSNTIWMVDGYYNPAPHEDVLGKQEVVFDRAKSECLKNLRAQPSRVEALTYDQFKHPKKYSG
jgi:hypothetical protein